MNGTNLPDALALAAKAHAEALTKKDHVLHCAALMLKSAEIWKRRALEGKPHEVDQTRCAEFGQTLHMTSGMLTILLAQRDALQDEVNRLKEAAEDAAREASFYDRD